MKASKLMASLSLTICLATCGASGAAASNGQLASEVHRIFETKCAGCHGSDLPRPQGRFGYVLDLRRISENPELIIPGEPAQSQLWILVEHDEMPPRDSPTGTLTGEERRAIREWIAAGAPSVAPSSTLAGPLYRILLAAFTCAAGLLAAKLLLPLARWG